MKAPLIEGREAGSRSAITVVIEFSECVQLGHLGTKEHVAQIRRTRRPSSELNNFEKSTFHSIKRRDSH